MSNLQPIELEDGTIIYIQAQTNPASQPTVTPESTEKLDFLIDAPAEDQDRIFGLENIRLNPKEQSEALKNTVQAYTKHIVKSFKELAIAEVTEVNLEFGINISAEGGVPYIANGTAGCNMNISVKCEFPKS
jgi:hypothetical protein